MNIPQHDPLVFRALTPGAVSTTLAPAVDSAWVTSMLSPACAVPKAPTTTAAMATHAKTRIPAALFFEVALVVSIVSHHMIRSFLCICCSEKARHSCREEISAVAKLRWFEPKWLADCPVIWRIRLVLRSSFVEVDLSLPYAPLVQTVQTSCQPDAKIIAFVSMSQSVFLRKREKQDGVDQV